MLVTCISTSNKSIPWLMRLKRRIKANELIHLEKGKLYPVYAVAFSAGQKVFFIRTETRGLEWYPSELFTISDPHFPREWVLGGFEKATGLEYTRSFPEWARNPHFYSDWKGRKDYTRQSKLIKKWGEELFELHRQVLEIQAEKENVFHNEEIISGNFSQEGGDILNLSHELAASLNFKEETCLFMGFQGFDLKKARKKLRSERVEIEERNRFLLFTVKDSGNLEVVLRLWAEIGALGGIFILAAAQEDKEELARQMIEFTEIHRLPQQITLFFEDISSGLQNLVRILRRKNTR